MNPVRARSSSPRAEREISSIRKVPVVPEDAIPLLASLGSRIERASGLLGEGLEGIGSNNWVTGLAFEM